MAVSTLIPSADLAPSVTSRVLIVRAIDFTEGAPATGTITFELPWDVDVKADGVILQAGRKVMTFDDKGQIQIRVPTADPDTNPESWFLLVKKSWAPHAYAIRVPVGTEPINLVDVPIVQEVPAGTAPGVLLTGASATVTIGPKADVVTTVAAGVANFDFTLPDYGPELDAVEEQRLLAQEARTGAEAARDQAEGYADDAAESAAAAGQPVEDALDALLPGRLDTLVPPLLAGVDDQIDGLRSDVDGLGASKLDIAVGVLPDTDHSLDDYKTQGTWAQTTSGQALVSRGYPMQAAGALTVRGASSQVFQTYRTLSTVPGVPGRVFERSFWAGGPFWSAWSETEQTEVQSVFDAWSAAVASGTATWLNLGSSTANGGNATAGRDWVRRVTALYTSAPLTRLSAVTAAPRSGIFAYSSAVGGTSSANYCSASDITKIGILRPTLITHMIGSNDWASGVTPSAYRANLIATLNAIDAVSPASLHVLIHQQGRWDVTSPANPWAAFGDVMREISATRPRVAFLDVDATFRKLGVPRPDFNTLMTTDKIHLNDDGHRVLADLVATAFQAPPSNIISHSTQVATTFSGGSIPTSGKEIASLVVTPSPYWRSVSAFMSLYATGTSGTSELAIQSVGGVGAQKNVRIFSTVSGTYSGQATFALPPHTTGTFRALAASDGALTVSSNAGYNSFFLEISPL